MVLLSGLSMSKVTQTSKYIDNFPTQKAKVDDIEIEYKTLGNKSGKPIIFIPGFRVTMDMWEPIILKELVSLNYSVIVFNHRGTENSSLGVREYSIGQLSNDAAGLLDALNIEKADVFGWSMGSYVAQDLALLHPNKVNNLILYGSGPGGYKAVPSGPKLMETLNNISGTPEEQGRQILSLFFPQSWLQKNPEYINDFPLLKGTVSLETTQKQAEAIIKWNGFCDSPSQIIQPTLVLVGTEDVITTPKSSLLLVEKIPLVWLVQIRGAGHGWMYQYPERFSKVILTFLDVS
jgi:pimeloyl-ACP methyl ester carboxylesterase